MTEHVRLAGAAVDTLPLVLADRHRALPVGAELEVDPGDLAPELVDDLLMGAGFTVARTAADRVAGAPPVRAVRAWSLPDTVGPGMGLLVCGLNPSPGAADSGVGFFRAGNRFWPAAIAAGIVRADRAPRAALVDDGVGMTDLVKRTTARAADLRPDEYRDGMARVERLVRRWPPGAVVFVGLAGWRTAVDRRARPGVAERRIGEVPVYVMPSTSGLNAGTTLDELVGHLRAAAALAAPR